MQGVESKLDPRRFMEEGKDELSVIQDYQSDASVFKTFKEPEFSVQNFAEDGNTALAP